MRTAIQLYTLRDLDGDTAALLRRVGETEFDGVEFAGIDGDPGDVHAELSESELAVAGAHVGIEAFDERFTETLTRYRDLGCETLVVPYLDPANFATRAATERTARRLSALAVQASEAGVRFCYHNHDHEFVAFDDGTEVAFDVLVTESESELNFELDLGWLAAAGYDPVEYLDRMADRTPLVHLKDVRFADLTPVELGAGDLAVEKCVVAARDAGVEWLVYEHDQPTDPEKSLRHGAERLAAFRD